MTYPAPATPEQKMNLERLQSLYELIRRMNSVYDLPELLNFVVDRALSLTGGRRGLLLLNENYGDDLPRQVAVVRGEEVDPQRLEQIQAFVSNTVIQDVLARGEPRLVADLPTDERYEGVSLSATGQFKQVRSVLAVPLKSDQQPVGLLYIDHPRRAVFGPADLDFLSAFASQAALVIHRARQHQRQVEELTLLNELSRSMVQVLDLEEVLTRIVQEVCRMLNVETGSVLLLDETTAELVFATSVSNGRRVIIPTRLKKDEGIAGWVMTRGEPLCIGDVRTDTRWFGEVETGFITRSLLCVPLRLEDRMLGVLQALNKRSPGGFSPGDVALLSAFAASATISIENARLFREASQVHQLRALNVAALALSSTLELDRVLETGLEHARRMLRATAGIISLVEPACRPAIQAAYGLAEEEKLAGRQRQLLAELVARVVVSNVDEAQVFDAAQDPATRSLARVGLPNLALAPIKDGDEIRGALVVSRSTLPAFSAEDASLLVGIARILGLAIQNANHYNQVRAQATHLAYLNEVGGALTSSLDLTRVLQVIIQAVRVLLETERVSVFLIDPISNELVLRYGTEGDMDIRLPAPWQGIAGWVATHDRPALVNDALHDPRYFRQVALDTGYEAHSILCVPLKIEGKMIGVVEVLNKTGGQQFDYQDQTVLTDLTRWAAIAIHNARLFDERLQAYQRLAAEQKRRLAAEMRGAMAAVVLGMAHTMNNIIGAIRVWALNLENEPSSTLAAAQVKKVLGQIRQNADEAIELVRNMRGPLEQAVLAPTDVHECLAAAIKSCWWPDNVHLNTNYGPDIVPVKANAQRLETAFHNLLSNAIQALAPTGGQIWLQTCRANDGGVRIMIVDNGPGIPPELQGRLFDPGVSNKDGGLGIGLWLVETFIQQFEGDIEFTSTPGEGTTFVITLAPMPLLDTAASAAAGETSYDSAI